jgi:hypothetical protein
MVRLTRDRRMFISVRAWHKHCAYVSLVAPGAAVYRACRQAYHAGSMAHTRPSGVIALTVIAGLLVAALPGPLAR